MKNIKIAYPQNKETKSYLKKLGLGNYSEIGNMKFAEYDDANQNLDRKLNLELKNRKFWIASSTHNSEEIFCAKTHIILKRKYADLIIIDENLSQIVDLVTSSKTVHLPPHNSLNDCIFGPIEISDIVFLRFMIFC